jgi:hypothetical protein
MRACWAPVSVEPLGKTLPVVLSQRVHSAGGEGIEPLHAVLNCRSATAKSPHQLFQRAAVSNKQVDPRSISFPPFLLCFPVLRCGREGGGGGCIPSHSCKYNWRVGGVGGEGGKLGLNLALWREGEGEWDGENLAWRPSPPPLLLSFSLPSVPPPLITPYPILMFLHLSRSFALSNLARVFAGFLRVFRPFSRWFLCPTSSFTLLGLAFFHFLISPLFFLV